MTLLKLLVSVTLTIYPSVKDKAGKTSENCCTAVYISPNTALTAAHCVQEHDQVIRALPYDGGEFKATVLDKNTLMDLALLQISGPDHDFARFGPSPAKGQRIYLISSEEWITQTYAEGIVENIYFDDFNHSPMILHSASIKGGASGSGLFNSRGQLVGINTINWEGLSEAVTAESISYFLYCSTLRRQNDASPKTHASSPSWYGVLLKPFLLEFLLPQVTAQNLLIQLPLTH